jgi:hypothetical protein
MFNSSEVRVPVRPAPNWKVVDRELERRGHHFVRYADDCNIYVDSERAGQRVMESVTYFITHRLQLKVNQAKSAVARPGQRKFLGFSFTGEREPRRRIAPKAIARFKERIREQTQRTRGISLKRWSRILRPTCEAGSGTLATVKRPRCWHVLKLGYAADFGRWCGSNGSRDGHVSANFASGASERTSRHKLPGVLTARGGLRTRPLSPSLCRMPTLPSSGSHPWSCGLSLIRRTAVCGPACTVVWQGSRGDPFPYAHRPRARKSRAQCEGHKLHTFAQFKRAMSKTLHPSPNIFRDAPCLFLTGAVERATLGPLP